MSEIIVLQHIGCEAPGTIAQALAQKNISLRTVRGFEGQRVPLEMGKASALLVMGGPMGVDEEEKYPFLRDEIHLIENALARKKPVLGVCLGSQLLAKALGAGVRKGPRKEIGWFPVRLSEAARQDTIWAGAPVEFTPLHWHGDVFDLPRGATALAASSLTAHQAFVWGGNAYGVLFHMEITEAMLGEWVRNFAGELEAEGLDGKAILREAPARMNPLHAVGSGVFGRWAGLVNRT